MQVPRAPDRRIDQGARAAAAAAAAAASMFVIVVAVERIWARWWWWWRRRGRRHISDCRLVREPVTAGMLADPTHGTHEIVLRIYVYIYTTQRKGRKYAMRVTGQCENRATETQQSAKEQGKARQGKALTG